MSSIFYPSVFKKIYAIIGYDHRGCKHSLNNLRQVLLHYAADTRVQILLVTNIHNEIGSWGLEAVTPIFYQKQGLYSHNQAMLVGLSHVPSGAAVAFVDADKIFIRGCLFSSVAYLDAHPLVAPLGVMHTANPLGEKQAACIPSCNIIGRKELLVELVQAIGGSRIRAWGVEDLALLIAARQRGIFAKRHYVETLHFCRRRRPGATTDHLLQGICSALKLPLMDARELRLHALQAAQPARGFYNAMRGLGSAHYLRELCAIKTPLEVHVLNDGRNDFLGQIHHAGLHIHSDNLPCEQCANSDAVGSAIWEAHRRIAKNLHSQPSHMLHNLWYATVAAGWSMFAWQHIQSLTRSDTANLPALESFARRGLEIALSGLPCYEKYPQHHMAKSIPANQQILSVHNRNMSIQ